MSCVATSTIPGQVRTLVSFRLTEWGLLAIADDVQLVASELITNALRCTPDREMRVRLTREPGSVLLGVWDSSDEMPVARRTPEPFLDAFAPDPCALDAGYDAGTCGRGLPIVEALSSRCGVDRTRPHGKWVWSRISS
ncbi:ATP-binding protein [Actinomadura sp. LOL_016]|uniref:ATP-binding protein n=1 Tax=unclassified Actinomadura TaxID=2626254 RepID=UPI003A7FA59D